MSGHKTDSEADHTDWQTRLLRIGIRTVAIAGFAVFVVLTVVLLIALGS